MGNSAGLGWRHRSQCGWSTGRCRCDVCRDGHRLWLLLLRDLFPQTRHFLEQPFPFVQQGLNRVAQLPLDPIEEMREAGEYLASAENEMARAQSDLTIEGAERCKNAFASLKHARERWSGAVAAARAKAAEPR